MALKPLFMWAGGKTKLLKHYAPILKELGEFESYVEPFFGGGAVFGHLYGKDSGLSFVGKPSFINDTNSEIVGLLQAIRDDHESLLKEALSVADKVLSDPEKTVRKKVYYSELQKYWASPTPGALYALMKLGFNGIWQTNKKSNGLYATPAGLLNQVDSSKIFNQELVGEWADVLQNASITAGDYREVSFPRRKALVFLDPPYRDSFTTYGTGFSDDDQREVVRHIHELTRDGATVLFSNRCVDGDSFFEDLLPVAKFHYFNVTYTAGRRKRVGEGFEAKPAREFLAVITPGQRA